MKALLLIPCFALVSCGGSSSGSKKSAPGRSTEAATTLSEEKLFGSWESPCMSDPFPKKVNVVFTPEFKFIKVSTYYSPGSKGCSDEDASTTSVQEDSYKLAEPLDEHTWGLDLTGDDHKTKYYSIRLNGDGSIQVSTGFTNNPDIRVTSFDENEKLKKQAE